MSQAQTRMQFSAGGVVFRMEGGRVNVALISVGEDNRWQLPKGLIDQGESPEAAAVREVREETGIEGEMVAPLDKVEYWYFSKDHGRPIRFHKFVYFYLLRYRSGSTRDHDHEVNEARWADIEQAVEMLAFNKEKEVVERAGEMIARMNLEA